MNIKLLYDYYSIGSNYALLIDGKQGSTIEKVRADLFEYGKFLRENNLEVTIKAVGVDLTNFYESLGKKGKTKTFSSEDSSAMLKILNSADKTLDSELALREAYILTDKRFALKTLLEKVDDLFAKDVFPKLSEIAKFDFYEAGKCIAFERPTAAAFHLLRATEATVRVYYFKLVKKKLLANPTWGGMTAEMRKKRASSKLLLDGLDYIRSNFRNPTQHPDLRYSLDEGQDLFGLCIDSTNRLVKEIDKI